MMGSKTSVEKAREEEKSAAADDMFGGAFGSVEEITPPVEEPNEELEEIEEELNEESEEEEENSEEEPVEVEEVSEEKAEKITGPPSGPPSAPPSGPPSAPPSGPPSAPPSGLPSGPPPGPPSKPPVADTSDEEDSGESDEDNSIEDVAEEEITEGEEVTEEEKFEEAIYSVPDPNISNRAVAAEKEAIRLSGEVNSLRKSLSGAAEIIEELENPPMPPAVFADIVVPDHLVADISRLARLLDREQLVRASMGTIAMLHPGMPGVMISTKENTLLPRLDERGITGARLGQGAPEEAPSDWRVLEVLLASTSLETGGPAACIHMHGAYTTAVSCEKDLILCSPIDDVGKKMLGKIIIVDPDDDNPEDFLRQTADALKQGGMKCVIIRGYGAYCVGQDLDDAWANAAMLENSMQIVLLARQANLKL